MKCETLLLIASILGLGAEFAKAQSATEQVHGTLNLACEQCHTTKDWQDPTRFSTYKHTRFALEGAHQSSDCRSCHISLVFSEVGKNCIDCHQDVHEAKLGFDCASCHEPVTWAQNARMKERHESTAFPLLGVHAQLACDACHLLESSAEWTGLSADCVACHRSDYATSTSPDHTSAKFSNDCLQCHTVFESGWVARAFVHPGSFSLEAGHAGRDCIDCHATGYSATPTDCYSCHAQDYNATTDPNHVAQSFPTDCTNCHQTSAWSPASFDHNQTGFPLSGGHQISDCSACHAQGYSNTPTDCVACHREDFNGTTNPNHVTSGFSSDCMSCHTTNAWSPAQFDHSQTGFQLSGGHNISDCLACHSQGYSNTPTACLACHQLDYEGTVDPNHVASNFPTSCETCHTINGWEPASFDHSQTSFPLVGGHNLSDCLACHSNGYTNTPTECAACHRDDYDAVTDPNHVSNNFPLTCETCHTTNGWEPANFDHDQTSFPLTFGHNISDCQACHAQGYNNTPTACIACHQSDYNNADPNHVAAGFPTDCTLCHDTRRWDGAVFNHSFPIYSGAHRGEWNTCSECHVVPNNYAAFECINCHEHNQGDMDDEHRGVSGYVYQSQSCYNCHPRGQEE